MTIYTVKPCRGPMGDWRTFSAGMRLQVNDVLAADVPLILLRHSSGLNDYGYVEGDGAAAIRADGVKRLRVTELNELSGTAQACAEEDAK